MPSAPLFTIDVDTAPLVAALRALPEAVHQRVQDACQITAERLAREMRSRLQRQLGPAATGTTVASIGAEPAYDGDGWVVFAERDPLDALPLWLEKGTKSGARHNFARTAPRPFFYASIELEVGPHERLITAALEDAADETGLGD